MIKVVKSKYSKKMREIKVYAPQERFIVIVPKRMEKKSASSVLKRL
ncbi:MAG: hypothetical protein ACXQTD_05135 [Candidatus Syntropharchaeia archaeon]